MNIDEFNSICENKFDTENDIIYKAYFPKVNEQDYEYVRNVEQFLWDFFDNGYKYPKLKEFSSCINTKSLCENVSCLKEALYKDTIVALSIYTDYQGGMKCVAITATTDLYYRDIGKYAVRNIVKEDINLTGQFYWTVCSVALERLYEKYGGIKIPNDYLDLFISKYKSKSDDGYHFSTDVTYGDGETEDVRKIIFGFNSRDTFELIKKRNDEMIMTCINRITKFRIKEMEFVKDMSEEDYYTEVVYVFYEDRVDGNKDYSDSVMNLLKVAVDKLKCFVESHKNNSNVNIRKYMDAIENGEELISTAIVMDLHTDLSML